MKKLLTLLFTIALAFSLTMPTLAKEGGKKEAAATTEEGKAHKKHAKKKEQQRVRRKGLPAGTHSARPGLVLLRYVVPRAPVGIAD